MKSTVSVFLWDYHIRLLHFQEGNGDIHDCIDICKIWQKLAIQNSFGEIRVPMHLKRTSIDSEENSVDMQADTNICGTSQ